MGWHPHTVTRQSKATTSALVRAGTIAANFVHLAYIGRTLGASASAPYYTWIVVSSIAGILGRRGTDIRVLRTRPEMSASQWPALWKRTLIGSTITALSTAAISLTTGWPGGTSTLSVAMALSIVPTSLTILCASLLRAQGRSSMGAVFELGLSQTLLVALCAATSPFHRVGINTVAICLVIASGITYYLAQRWATHDTEAASTSGAGMSESDRRSMTLISMSSAAYFYLNWIPVITLSTHGSSTDVAYFSSSNRICNVLAIVPLLQLTRQSPRISNLYFRGDLKGANSIIRSMNIFTAALVLPVSILIIAFPQIPLLLFGNTFEGAIPTLQVLCLAQAVRTLLGPTDSLALATGAERPSLYFGAAAAVAGSLVLLLLAPQGATVSAGAYGAMMLSYSLANAVYLRSKGVHSYLAISFRREA